MSRLFSRFKLGNIELANRIVISPMCQYSAEEGKATDWHLIHLGHLALSGAGLLFIEAAAVEPAGRITPQDLGLWSADTEAALARVIKSIRKYASIPIAIQLAHAGRKASCQAPWLGGKQLLPDKGGWQTVAPSAISFAEQDITPQVLEKSDLQRITDSFVTAALRAVRMGINVIELHAAHGYLLHEFLSPLSNQRSDRYGGGLENRMRFPLAVFEAVKHALPDTVPLGVRISASDWIAGGWDIEQSIVFSNQLKQRGCSFIDVSSGGLSTLQKIPVSAGYQVAFAEQIKHQTQLPTIAVGLITEPEQAESILVSEQADLVALARGMLYDPRWPWHAAAKLGEQVTAPPQYLRSQPHTMKDLFKQK